MSHEKNLWKSLSYISIFALIVERNMMKQKGNFYSKIYQKIGNVQIVNTQKKVLRKYKFLSENYDNTQM